VRRAEAACFAFGWGVLAIALLPPLDTLTHRSFAMHMIQHELLMVVAAPLLVLARPLEAWAWALPSGAQRSLHRMSQAKLLRRPWRAFSAPLGAWTFHALSIWVWHVPVLFTLALESVALHILQHGCFFGSALAFWWAAFGKGTRAAAATSIASLFTTMLHTSALGALLTFAPTVWYATGAESRVRSHGARRPAARRPRDVGAGRARLHDRGTRDRRAVARSRRARRQRNGRP
jgi:putative membrane protein